MPDKKLVLLCVLDGWGISTFKDGDAISKANKPTFDMLDKEYPHTTLKSFGEHVGLPEGQMGNSEVGHLNLGAGRVIIQDLPRITKSINDESFFENEVFLKAVSNSKSNNTSIHLIGLLSDGGVHSHIEHLYGLLKLCKKNNVEKVFVHALLDGRDTDPQSAKKYLLSLQEKMKTLNVGRLSTITGRYYAMDRDNRWDRVLIAYNAMVYGEGVNLAESVSEAIEKSYLNGDNDEFVKPVICDSGNTDSFIKDTDSVIFFNFRSDRMRQIVKAFIKPDFEFFNRKEFVNPMCVTFTEYEKNFSLPVAYPQFIPENGLGQVISNSGLNQLRIAETEKYAHVTFFFNGGIEDPFSGEDRILVPSPKVATYDEKPEMSACIVTEKLVDAIKSKKYGFILVNFANPDMVGHTGFIDAAVSAVEAVDTCVGKIVDAVKSVDGTMLITSDHGNAECMKDADTGKVVTAHTTNPVPFYLISDMENKLAGGGVLADVAPTVLSLLGITIPSEMTGDSLIVDFPK